MDFGAAFSYMFKDPDWVKKVLIGALLVFLGFLLVPLVFIAGYYVKTTKNIAAGKDVPLPEWDDWGGLFTSGIKLIVVGLIYGLALGIVAFIVSAILGPLGLLLAFLLRLAYIVFAPAVTMKYIKNEEIGDAFKFKEIWELIVANPSDYAVLVLLTIVAGFIGGIGVIALVIGVFFTAIYAMLISANLIGQYMKLYGEGVTQGQSGGNDVT